MMGIEFSVKIARPFLLGELVASAERILDDLFVTQTRVSVAAPGDLVLGSGETNLVISIDDDTVAALFVHTAGEERDLGLDGGYWLSVSPSLVCNERSLVFSVLVAVAAAEVLGVPVVDDWFVLGSGGELSAAQVLALIRDSVEGGSFDRTVRNLTDKLGLEST